MLYTALSSLSAISIDAMLPALRTMDSSLSSSAYLSIQHVISLFVFGMIVGELAFGPLADALGRRRSLITGLMIYLTGSAICWLATSLELVILGRVLQGIGASGPKIAVRAMIRDQFDGDRMAGIMSLIFALMVVVPLFAPGLGQIIMHLWEWRSIFALSGASALILAIWFLMRHPETLRPLSRRTSPCPGLLVAARQVLSIPQVTLITIAGGLIFGSELVYFTTAADLFASVYGVQQAFPLYFSGLALPIAAACLANGLLVERFGMARLTMLALRILTVTALALAALAFHEDSRPPLPAFLGLVSVVFFCWGILFGNLNALAMVPLADNAGLGASIISAGSSLIAVGFGLLFGSFHEGGMMAFVCAIFVSSLGAHVLVRPPTTTLGTNV